MSDNTLLPFVTLGMALRISYHCFALVLVTHGNDAVSLGASHTEPVRSSGSIIIIPIINWTSAKQWPTIYCYNFGDSLFFVNKL